MSTLVTVTGTILAIHHARTSRNGNPTYRILLTDGREYLTQADGSVGYSAPNHHPHSRDVKAGTVPVVTLELIQTRGGERVTAIHEHDVTCVTCGKTWPYDLIPTPAGRCPFEDEHDDPEDDEDDELHADVASLIGRFFEDTSLGGTDDDLQTERVARLIELLAVTYDIEDHPEVAGFVIVPTATWNAVLAVATPGQGLAGLHRSIEGLRNALADDQAAAHEPTD